MTYLYPRLHFKASDESNGQDHENPQKLHQASAVENLHLCTATQSYQVRQVSTSNSVYVVTPSVTYQKGAHTKDDSPEQEILNDNAQPQPTAAHGMSAIAKLDTMLELFPVQYDVLTILARALPLFDKIEDLSLDQETALSYLHSRSVARSKSQVFASIPAPDSQLENAWRELMAFEFEGRCARAGPGPCLSAWRILLDQCVLNHTSVTAGFDFDAIFHDGELTSSLLIAITQAILFHVSRNIDQNTGVSITKAPRHILLSESKTTAWTGMTLLRAGNQTPSQPFPKSEFLRQWKDLLPEEWRQKASLQTDSISAECYNISAHDNGCEMISWRDGSLVQSNGERAWAAATKFTSATTTTAAVMPVSKRKWHEKFKAQRKDIKK